MKTYSSLILILIAFTSHSIAQELGVEISFNNIYNTENILVNADGKTTLCAATLNDTSFFLSSLNSDLDFNQKARITFPSKWKFAGRNSFVRLIGLEKGLGINSLLGSLIDEGTISTPIVMLFDDQNEIDRVIGFEDAANLHLTSLDHTFNEEVITSGLIRNKFNTYSAVLSKLNYFGNPVWSLQSRPDNSQTFSYNDIKTVNDELLIACGSGQQYLTIEGLQESNFMFSVLDQNGDHSTNVSLGSVAPPNKVIIEEARVLTITEQRNNAIIVGTKYQMDAGVCAFADYYKILVVKYNVESREMEWSNEYELNINMDSVPFPGIIPYDVKVIGSDILISGSALNHGPNGMIYDQWFMKLDQTGKVINAMIIDEQENSFPTSLASLGNQIVTSVVQNNTANRYSNVGLKLYSENMCNADEVGVSRETWRFRNFPFEHEIVHLETLEIKAESSFQDYDIEKSCERVTTSTINEGPENEIVISPNPSYGEFEISNINKDYKWKAFDIEGNEILLNNKENGRYRIDQSGMFFLRMNTEKGVIIRKIMIIQ